MHRSGSVVFVVLALTCLWAAAVNADADVTKTVLRAGCHGKADPGTPNNYAPLAGTSLMKLIGTSSNGKAYRVTVPNGGNSSTYTLLHVYGTAYEMGFAQGTIMKNVTRALVDQVWAYMLTQIEQALPNYFPAWFSAFIAEMGLEAALTFTEELSYAYTPVHFLEEMHGLCDASGADFSTVYRIHMIAGLTQGKCSMFGAWGQAIPQSGSLVQLRALDWDMDGPFRDFSQITVYHPSNTSAHAFANVGFTGFIGGLTGLSATQLGISEIGVAFPDDINFGTESRIGQPFIFLLRDILQFDNTVDDAINRMINTRRTCDLILGVGDGKLGIFRGFAYSYAKLKIFDDMNAQPTNVSWHPRIIDTVYWGMDWLCPSYNELLSDLLIKYHGNVTPQNGMQYISAIEKSGDNHIAYYDLTKMQLWVSFAAPRGVGGPVAAYDRQYTQWDANALFAEKL